MKELNYLNKYFYKYRNRFLLGLLITIIAQIVSLYSPELIGNSIQIIEKHIKSSQPQTYQLKKELLKNIILIIGATLFAGFLTFLMRQTLIVMSRHIEFDLKNEIFQHYQVLSQNFYKKNKVGDLMNRISEDVAKVRMYVGPAVMYTINTAIRFISIIAIMVHHNKTLTFYAIIPLPFLSYFIFKISNSINKKSTLYQESLSKLTSFTQEYFSGIRVVKAYTLENEKQNIFYNQTLESKNRNIALVKTNALFGPLMIFFIGISYLLVLLIGGNLYQNGEIKDLGVLAQFLIYIGMLVWPVTSFGWVTSLVQEAEASQKRINEFLKTKDIIENNGILKPEINGQIEFKNVSFKYEDSNNFVLKNINLMIQPNQKTAIIGNIGTGKTTLFSLIVRLFEKTEGAILINNTPIKEIELNYLRENISFVPQDVFLFSDTIKNNISFGNTCIEEKQIIEAAKNAEVYSNIIAMKNQFNTEIGERGINISGGQKQRLTIARALLKNSKIFIFDDCLSAVDVETEERIMNNFNEILKDKTVIYSTNRITAAKKADQIIVLDNHTVLESGTHNQLINNKGYYSELYFKQILEKEN